MARNWLGMAASRSCCCLAPPPACASFAQRPPTPGTSMAGRRDTRGCGDGAAPAGRAGFRQGVGTVQAYQAVLVRARVDGTLDKVAVPRRPGREARRPAGRDRSPPVPAALAQAQAKKAPDEAQLANARLDLARYADLARSDFASRQQVDTQQATGRAGRRPTSRATRRRSTPPSSTSTSASITSPIDGVVGLRLVDIGNMIHATDATGIVTITQIHPISVVFTLPQDDAAARCRRRMAQAARCRCSPTAPRRQDRARRGHAADASTTRSTRPPARSS